MRQLKRAIITGFVFWNLICGLSWAGSTWIAQHDTFACISIDAYHMFFSMISDHDEKGLTRMLMSGECIPVERGQRVYMLDLSIFSASKIRVPGSSIILYTDGDAFKSSTE